MKRLVLIINLLSGFVIWVPGQSPGHPVISEIRYDERSGINEEFVELYNPTPEIIRLEGWSMAYQTRTGSSWRTKVQFGSGHQLSSHGYFLWGGDAVNPQPDIAESVQSSLGFSNSGGHIALMDPAGSIIDLVAWEGGIHPEGEADAGETEDGGSLERKASATSSAATMKRGGKEALSGNGYDSDRNSMDFVVQGVDDVVPQNSLSSPEPVGSQLSPIGSVSISPAFAYAGQSTDFHITVTAEPDTIVQCIGILIPWDDMKNPEKIIVYSNQQSRIPVNFFADTLIIELMPSRWDSLTIDLRSVQVQDQSTEVACLVMTGHNRLPVPDSPVIKILDAPTPISMLHENNEMGIPRMMGERVSIQGIVTMGNRLESDLQTDFFIQDSSGGLRIFARYAQQTYRPGDVLLLTGTVHQYRGMTELIPEWQYVWLQSEAVSVPEPVIMTCEQINHTFQPDCGEPNEGLLIRLDQAVYDPLYSLLTDSTGTCQLYIDVETGFEIQGGRIQLTGILFQNKRGLTDPGPPYRNDYCIRPRTELDMIPLSDLRFLKQPEIKEWYEDGVTLSFETSLPCTCRIIYGWVEYDSTIISLSRAVNHTVRLTGLQPATIYHYQIICSDGLEELNLSGSFVTRSFSDAKISVFFNGGTRGSAVIQSAVGQQDLYRKFIECVEAAEHSIDFCFMKLTHKDVQEALLQAFERGVKVRFICEEDEAGSEEVLILKELGIPVLTDCSGANQGKGIMHHKFAIFDHRDRSSLDDDRVWTGSFNPTDYGQFPQPNENVVLIEDAALAAIYTAGFEIMWGSDRDSPDTEYALFEAGAFNQLPHKVMTGETLIEVFFSPEGDAGVAIETALRSVDHSLAFCMYSFTRSTLANAIIDLAHIQDINIRGLLDSRQIEADGIYSQWDRLSASSEQIRKYIEGPLLHHKYAIIDAMYDSSDPTVITGSYNWTSSAEVRNNENVILIHNAEIAELYRHEFEARYDERTQRIDNPLPLCWRLDSNFPNPFNVETLVSFELPKPSHVVLSVVDVLGRSVRTLLNQHCGAGNRRVEWDGRNDEGRLVSNGVYLIRLISSEYSDQIKAVFMK